jgi:TPR repeat protein
VPAFLRGRAGSRLADWQAAAAENDAQGQFMLGLYEALCQSGEVKQAGIGRLKDLATAGMPEAGFWLGTMHLDDRARAAEWLLMAAERGHAWSQLLLGLLLDDGSGPRGSGNAVEWLTKAAEQGLADAQETLGTAYFEGKLVSKDFAAAIGWWRKAADQGLDGSQYSLGVMYLNGWGCEKDVAEARKWLRLAAAQEGKYAERARQLEQATDPFVMDVYRCQRCGREQLGGDEGRSVCPNAKCRGKMVKAGQAKVRL